MKDAAQKNWAGVDWGDTSHSLCVVDGDGKKVLLVEVPHTAEGLEEMIAKLREFAPVGGVAIETKRSLLVQKFIEAGFVVYPINPKVSKAWRDGWSPASPKTDPHDAHMLADGLQHRHGNLRPLSQDDPLTRELSMLCADESRLICERTALVNRLRATLKEYHPAALEWFSDWTTPTSWNFILKFPKPADLAGAPAKKLTGFLKTHNIGISPLWQQRIDGRKKASEWPGDVATIEAKSFLAVAIAKQLRTLHASLTEYRKRIEKLFDDHPDSDIFTSLPGAGAKLAPRLLSGFGSQRDRYDCAKAVQQLSGAVPVTESSGSRKHVKFRRACQKDFRKTMHQFAWQSVERCVWAKAFYKAARSKGQTHNLALRNLAAKWIKIIYRMWVDKKPYDESVILSALILKNSPVVHLIPSLKGCEKL